jgi:hypothetical protein
MEQLCLLVHLQCLPKTSNRPFVLILTSVFSVSWIVALFGIWFAFIAERLQFYRDYRIRGVRVRILRPSIGWLSFLPLILVVLVSGFGSAALHAQAGFDGRYRCVRVEVGHQAAQCQSPPLILSGDGSYQIWGEHGTYEVVQDQWLVLSHSKRRGLGHFVGADEIVFEYKIGGKLCRVTFREIYVPPPGFDLG